MSTMFAVMAITEGSDAPEFSMVKATEAQNAIATATQAYLEAGKTNTHIVAVFTRADLAQLDTKLAEAEKL